MGITGKGFFGFLRAITVTDGLSPVLLTEYLQRDLGPTSLVLGSCYGTLIG